ncbi:MAG: DUF4351 domain-containing protein [Tepidanaerobacteraceae bacterium]|nr:DUF4351 domain-containing protein [Tepidanaerobacteraceae bacterium]
MEQENRNISYQNYDIVFKYATSMLKGTMLDFLGVSSAPIVEVIPTELPYIEARRINEDYIFKLKDDTLLHLEYQSTLKHDDLIRFMIYDARLYEHYRKTIHTAIIYTGNMDKITITDKINAGSIKYKTKITKIEKNNAAKTLTEQEQKIKKREKPDIPKILFLPLMSKKEDIKENTQRAIKLIKEIPEEEHEKDKLIATIIVLVDKLLDKETLDKLWEEFRMLNVFKYAEERGKQVGLLEGIEKGIERGMEKGIADTVVRQLYKKLGKLPDEYKEKILSQDRPTLELIAEHIFEIGSLSDIDKFLKH